MRGEDGPEPLGLLVAPMTRSGSGERSGRQTGAFGVNWRGLQGNGSVAEQNPIPSPPRLTGSLSRNSHFA